jgi:sugar diacid utilization regulator
MDRPNLLLEGKAGVFWGWVGQKEAFDPAQVETLASNGRKTSPDSCLAIGEPGQGLSGWRLTHHQARAALAVGVRGNLPVVRFADVALLATAIRDDLLAASLRTLYIEPLEQGRGGGKELRCTLRAYFAADRNVSVAGDAIGVTRQAVARRLRTVEERLGRPIASCAPDLELALRLEALESAPTRLSVP